MIVAGTCSPLDQKYVTAMPGVATSAMAENHTKTDSIRLQLQVECWYEQEELPEARLSSPTIRAQPRNVTFLTIKTVVRKIQKNDGQIGSCARTRRINVPSTFCRSACFPQHWYLASDACTACLPTH